MSRQGRGFPKAVSSIVSSHHPASRVRISLTLTDNWKCCIVFSSSPAFVTEEYQRSGLPNRAKTPAAAYPQHNRASHHPTRMRTQPRLGYSRSKLFVDAPSCSLACLDSGKLAANIAEAGNRLQ